MLTGKTVTDEQIRAFHASLPHGHRAASLCADALQPGTPSHRHRRTNARREIAEMINSDSSSVTGDTITAEQIREMRDEYPEIISGEKAANALALPYAHTAGGIPTYPDVNESQISRNEIAALYRAKRG